MRKIYNLVIAFILLALPFCVQAQVSVLTNNGVAANFVGWNNGNNFPLQIRHKGNQPMFFATFDINRMKLNQGLTYSINGAANTNIDRTGYLLLGADNNFSGTSTSIYNTGAFSLLHLNGYGATGIDPLGYRNWMQTGITLTGNRDLAYFGLRKLA